MPDALPSALDRLEAILALDSKREISLCLDYDGTLTPIVGRPEEAILSPSMRRAIERVAHRCAVVAVVSGRDRTVVERLVGVPGLAYIGSHGYDIAGPPGSGVTHEVGLDYLPALDSVQAALEARLGGIDGALVERKRFNVAVHYRLLGPDGRRQVHAAVSDQLRRFPNLTGAEGKAVLEVRPDLDWNKGRAILWLLDALDRRASLAMHIGDDLTDESAFEALRDRGVGIVVMDQPRATAARFALRDPGEVEAFLGRLTRAIERDR